MPLKNYKSICTSLIILFSLICSPPTWAEGLKIRMDLFKSKAKNIKEVYGHNKPLLDSYDGKGPWKLMQERSKHTLAPSDVFIYIDEDPELFSAPTANGAGIPYCLQNGGSVQYEHYWIMDDGNFLNYTVVINANCPKTLPYTIETSIDG